MKKQGVLPYVIEILKRSDAITAWAGLPLVVETMRAFGLDRLIKECVHVRMRERGYSETKKIETIVELMSAGGECVDDVEILRADPGLQRLQGNLPGPDALLNFLYEFHDDELIEQAKARRTEGHRAYIPEENKALQGLAKVNVEFVRRAAAQGKGTRATLDHDATIQESHKREAQYHYKGGRGYQPSVIYWAEQDMALADEYRDGNVPAGMSNLPLIKRGFASLPETITERNFRADSACYEEKVLKWLANPEREDGPKGHIGFTISADMTTELRRICEAVEEASWALADDRPHETVQCAEVEFTPGDWPKDAQPLRYLALRIRAKQGELFANGSTTKYLAVVTNRDGQPIDILRWHWKKAGTIEFVHDVTKNDLGARVPPCGRFGANAAWFRLSLLTYNVQSAMKSLALPSELSKARPKRLRFCLFSIAGRIISSGGKLILRIAKEIEERVNLIAARRRLAALHLALL